jgi:hypothetical protein
VQYYPIRVNRVGNVQQLLRQLGVVERCQQCAYHHNSRPVMALLIQPLLLLRYYLTLRQPQSPVVRLLLDRATALHTYATSSLPMFSCMQRHGTVRQAAPTLLLITFAFACMAAACRLKHSAFCC